LKTTYHFLLLTNIWNICIHWYYLSFFWLFFSFLFLHEFLLCF